MAHTTIPLRAPQDKARSALGLAPKRSTTSQRITTNAIHAPESPRRPTRQRESPPDKSCSTTPSRGQGGGVFLPSPKKRSLSPSGGRRGARAQRGWLIPPSPSEHPKTRSAATQAWLPRDQPPVKEPPPTPSTRPSPPGARRASESESESAPGGGTYEKGFSTCVAA
jgi:hypothetical protein